MSKLSEEKRKSDTHSLVDPAFSVDKYLWD